MKTKHLLIPIAAFAVTVTGVSAFDTNVLREVGLPENQIEAFEEAKKLREEGDRDAARDVLAEAGIDLDTLHELRNVMHANREERQDELHEAIESGDYEAFTELAHGRMTEVIESKKDFLKLQEAHQFREEGDFEHAKAIMEELGMPSPHDGHHVGRMEHMRHMNGHDDVDN